MFENGFVLLKNALYDYEKLIDTLQSDWQISLESIELSEESMNFSVNDSFCSLALMPAPVPNGEAQQRAQGNYYCQDAVSLAENHQAHLMVTIMNQSGNSAIEHMTLYSKIIASCLAQEHATAVYTSGTVFSADFYRSTCQQYFTRDGIPFVVWVFIGLGQNENGNQLFTIGMEKFDKEEMEILNNSGDMQSLHASLSSMCNYIITSGLVLQDGETIGFSADEKWEISRSESVYASTEYSLKISL